MGNETVTPGDIETEKKKFYRYKSHIFFKDVAIEKVLVFKKISLVKKAINTFLVTCIRIVKLSYYVECFLKQAII